MQDAPRGKMSNELVNDTLILQHVFGKHGRIIAMTVPRTIEYCLQHHIDYQMVLSDVVRDGNHVHWAHTYLIRDAMIRGYKNIIYWDADTLIADMGMDIKEAIVEDKIGSVWHNLKKEDKDLSHFNVGALYFSNTPKTREFMDRWIAGYPGTSWSSFPLVFEQGVFNIIGEEMGIINRLDNKWNAECGVSPSDHPAVFGFHGFPDLYNNMKKKLENLND
jgi:hypothetical protein